MKRKLPERAMTFWRYVFMQGRRWKTSELLCLLVIDSVQSVRANISKGSATVVLKEPSVSSHNNNNNNNNDDDYYDDDDERAGIQRVPVSLMHISVSRCRVQAHPSRLPIVQPFSLLPPTPSIYHVPAQISFCADPISISSCVSKNPYSIRASSRNRRRKALLLRKGVDQLQCTKHGWA